MRRLKSYVFVFPILLLAALGPSVFEMFGLVQISSFAAMALAVNRLIELQGGCVGVAGRQVLAELALPVAGLMSERPFEEVAARLRELRRVAGAMGCAMTEPFLQLAFLPLPVIPHLKLTDLGLVDVDRFELIAA